MEMESQTLNLYITYVEKEGPFLKVWGQTEKNNSIYVEQFLLGASPQFDLGVGKISVDNLHPGTLVCAKYKDNKYYRARITNTSFLSEGFVEVSFLDYGNKDIVPSVNIRSLQNFPSSFISVPPLATGFIFAEAHCPGGGEWNDTILENISKELKYREVQCTLIIQATQYFLVKLYIGGSDLCSLLINRGLMQPISLQAQQAVLLSMSMQRTNVLPAPQAPSVPTGINTYKACTLEPGCQYPVYVSYVNDGPCHFSVQLKQSEDVLVMLMSDINTITLRLLEDIPIPGTICLARCQEDGNICRAVVTNEVDNQFKVFYVDFGNYEVVPLDALFQIPFKYVIPKVMAIRFSLAGVEKSTVTLEMQCAFKKFVDNRLLYMKVLPTPTRMAIPKCELWDPETKTSALDVVNRAAQNAYPEPVSLNRGFSQLVKVSFVYGCNRFYVQLASKENELIKLMLDLQSSCQINDPMDPNTIKMGLPCCALFEADQQWYRSQIVDIPGNNVKVRYIDYGNEEIVSASQLKIIDGEQLTVLRPQAIECCLNGYQNMEEDPQRDGFLEELTLEKQFTMKVVEMTNKKALVELFNESDYNIASLLLDKLASAKSQVSPMLVQAGNKIEHRKSFSNQNSPREQNFRQDRRPGRTNDRNESWKQDRKDFRSTDGNSNENGNERNSWRQNNKGFSPNSERFNNRDRNRNRNDWDNKENVGMDSWEPNKPEQNGTWSKPSNNGGFPNNSRENDFSRNRGDRFNKDNWNSGPPKVYKKRNDFRKDGSDISSSGSENNFQKGPRTSSRSDRPQFQKKFDKPRSALFTNNADVNDSWNVSAVSSIIDAAPATATFAPYEVVGTVSNIIISWFHNPSHFYCQLEDSQNQFKTLMAEIQTFYKTCKPESAVVGAPVIGLFPEDNVLYRAQVLEVLGGQYKVYYVDFGNVSNVTKVWPIDKKFMNFPAQAIVCSLNEIASPSDQWPNPDNYSKYFDKEKYVCKFVNKDEEKTYVEIFYGNDDIRQLIIQEGLAVSTQQIIPDIEIPLLLGQQFKAILKSINNLSDIIIALECGVALSCTMHNLENAVTTDDNTLKRFLERTVIIYVDNVLDDKLQVTLYDTEGSKIEVISPDEGACDMVELPCPILILRSNLTGFVSHADDKCVFIQPTEYSDTVAFMLDEMYESYENLTQDVAVLPEVELLYAAKSEDGNWYRAKVMNITDTQALVFYIDYGNSEEVDFDKLRQLFDKYLEICVLCIQVFVTVPTDTLVDKEIVATVYYSEENCWEGEVQLQTPEESSATESAEVDVIDVKDTLADNNISKISEEVTEELIAPVENTQEENLSEKTGYIEVPTEEIQTGTKVFVSHIDSPNEFYVQLSESLSAINQLQANLQELAPDMPVLETPTAGVLCAAPYSIDQYWYRADVLDADDDITTVRFVDFGNTDVINNETTKIKTLPPNLLSLAVYATRSSLKLKPTDAEWSTAAFEKFEALISESNVTAKFINQDEKTHYVELYSNGQNIKDILVQENLAVPCELSEENKLTCFVSHLNSPSEFWLQLESCVDELEWIAEQLSGAENFPELEDTTPGTLCAALFPDDQMWYRARILSDTVAGVELLYIDYGNSSISSSLRQLPEELVVTPPLVQKCSLQKPEGIPYWSPQAANKFKDISADGKTTFTVHKISTGETSVVQLFIDGQDVTSMLLPETEDGFIKNAESLDNFEIEKNGEILTEKYQLEPLTGTTWTEESTNKFKDLTDQGIIFQIEFIAEDTVRLYIDGIDIRTDLGGVKTAILNLSKNSIDESTIDIDPYLDDTVHIHISDVSEISEQENKERKSSEDEVVEITPPGSSDEDIKHILGISVAQEDLLQKDLEKEVPLGLLEEGSSVSDVTSPVKHEIKLELVKDDPNEDILIKNTEDPENIESHSLVEDETTQELPDDKKQEDDSKLGETVEDSQKTSQDVMQHAEQLVLKKNEDSDDTKQEADSKLGETVEDPQSPSQDVIQQDEQFVLEKNEDSDDKKQEADSKLGEAVEDPQNISQGVMQHAEQFVLEKNEDSDDKKQEVDSKLGETVENPQNTSQDVMQHTEQFVLEKNEDSDDKTQEADSQLGEAVQDPLSPSQDVIQQDEQFVLEKNEDSDDKKQEADSKLGEAVEDPQNISQGVMQHAEQFVLEKNEDSDDKKQKVDSKLGETVEDPQNTSQDVMQHAEQFVLEKNEDSDDKKQEVDSKLGETVEDPQNTSQDVMQHAEQFVLEKTEEIQELHDEKQEPDSKFFENIEDTQKPTVDVAQDTDHSLLEIREVCEVVTHQADERSVDTQELSDNENQTAPQKMVEIIQVSQKLPRDMTQDVDQLLQKTQEVSKCIKQNDQEFVATTGTQELLEDKKQDAEPKLIDTTQQVEKISRDVKLDQESIETTLMSTDVSDRNLVSENLLEAEVASILRCVLESAISKEETVVRNRPGSSSSGRISHDDRIVPAVASRPHSPLENEDVKMEQQVKSRPPSACSAKINDGERMVPAILPRPQSPIILSDNILDPDEK